MVHYLTWLWQKHPPIHSEQIPFDSCMVPLRWTPQQYKNGLPMGIFTSSASPKTGRSISEPPRSKMWSWTIRTPPPILPETYKAWWEPPNQGMIAFTNNIEQKITSETFGEGPDPCYRIHSGNRLWNWDTGQHIIEYTWVSICQKNPIWWINPSIKM